MFVRITNDPRPYEWGSTTAIADALGRPASGGPEAEVWFGAHPGSPSRLLEPDAATGATTLAELIAADPARTLGSFAAGQRLPFLLKLLAAGAPLSLQAHPTPEQAREGFARENAAGIPLDAPHRNYKDAFAKPELIVCLSAEFEALCGFRPIAAFRDAVDALRSRAGVATAGVATAELDALLDRAGSDAAIGSLVEWLSRGGPEVERLVDVVTLLAGLTPIDGEPATVTAELALARSLSERYPGDPGIVVSLLLHHVTLSRGEALYLPAGNIHAYLSGLGVELMAASDNVMRGGLTPKHVDVDELLRVLDTAPVPVPLLAPEHPSPGVAVFRPDVPDFELVRVTGTEQEEARVGLAGPAIALCIGGTMTLTGIPPAGGSGSTGVPTADVVLVSGESVFISPEATSLLVSGSGELFIATTGRS